MTTLTGRTRFRPYTTDNEVLLVLQVEAIERSVLPNRSGIFVTHEWRDATVEDLCEVQHLTYSNIQLTARVQLPEAPDALPGEEKDDARKLH
jgi:hypothetical protein